MHSFFAITNKSYVLHIILWLAHKTHIFMYNILYKVHVSTYKMLHMSTGYDIQKQEAEKIPIL